MGSYGKELIQRPRDGASFNGVFSGVISTTALTSTDLVSVIIPAVDDQIEYGPCMWQPRSDATLPERGDFALLVFDNERTPYIIAWWPQTIIGGGGGGTSDVRYVHTQSSANTTWTITHNLGLFPSVMLVDNSGNVISANINYSSNNQVVVTFDLAQAGKAYLS
jgi:hypothetical protein